MFKQCPHICHILYYLTRKKDGECHKEIFIFPYTSFTKTNSSKLKI